MLVHKKGDLITLLSRAHNLFIKVFTKRINAWIERAQTKDQMARSLATSAKGPEFKTHLEHGMF